MKLSTTISRLIDIVNHPDYYLRAKVDRIKGNAGKKIVDLIIKVIIFALMGLVGLMVLIFGSVTHGLWLNEVLESSFMGFLIVTGFYVLLLIGLVLIKDKDKITAYLFGVAHRAVSLDLESPYMFEQQPEHGSKEKKRYPDQLKEYQ